MKAQKIIGRSKEIYEKSKANEDGFFSLIIEGSEIKLLNHPYISNPQSALVIFSSEQYFFSKGVFKNVCIDYSDKLNVNFERPCVVTVETEIQLPKTINLLFNSLILSLNNSELTFEYDDILESIWIYFADQDHEYLYSYYFNNKKDCIQKINGDQKQGEMIIKTLLHSKGIIDWQQIQGE